MFKVNKSKYLFILANIYQTLIVKFTNYESRKCLMKIHIIWRHNFCSLSIFEQFLEFNVVIRGVKYIFIIFLKIFWQKYDVYG